MATEIVWSWVRHQPDSQITLWFERRSPRAGKPARHRGTTAVARKPLVVLWRYLDDRVIPDGAVSRSLSSLSEPRLVP